MHSTAHVPTDIAALRADFYVTSAYKWSGPHLAACVAKPETWERMRPDKLMPSPDTVPDRFEFGTLSFELLAGVAAAVDHLAGLDDTARGTRRERLVASMAEAHAYASHIFEKLVSGLENTEGVTVLPAPPGRCPTVSFRVDREAPATTATALGDRGICVYSGDYYAYEYFQSTGLRANPSAPPLYTSQRVVPTFPFAHGRTVTTRSGIPSPVMSRTEAEGLSHSQSLEISSAKKVVKTLSSP